MKQKAPELKIPSCENHFFERVSEICQEAGIAVAVCGCRGWNSEAMSWLS